MKRQIDKIRNFAEGLGVNRLVFNVSLLASSLLVFSCADDLEVDTEGELSAESFFTSVEDIETATLGVYSPLADKLLSNSEAYTHLWGADDRTAVTGSNKAFFLEYDQLQPLSTNQWQNRTWDLFWQIVGAANTFLDNEEKLREIVQGDDEALLDRSLGEVHFLRAFAYYEIVRAWGEVPLLTSQIGVTGQEPLASFQEIYDLIIEDLQFAKDNLDSAPVGGAYRATSWMAQSLLANVYLTTAGFPLKIEANYALAAQEAKGVIDNGPFALEAEYTDAMGNVANNLSGEGSTETIIAFPANAALDGWNAGNYQSESITFGDKTVEFAFYNNFPDGKRKEFTFDDGGDAARPIYSIEKFGGYFEWPQDKDIIYMRYAELLLIYSEAQVRATGNVSDPLALAAINEVRTRAELPDLTSATWEDIVWEKAWETAGEFTRWHDIVRTETLDEINALRADEDNELTPLGSGLTEQNPWAIIPADDQSANPNLVK